jgi:ribosome maturation factor RimP
VTARLRIGYELISQVVDEEVVMAGGSRHAPKPRVPQARAPRAPQATAPVDKDRIADVIGPVVAAAGMDLETVRVTAAGRRRLLRVVVDSDHGVSLDDAAAVSRDVAAVLESETVMGDFPYTLEVSSPGVDRPLTSPRHWRRATGRLVTVSVADSGESEPVTGRITAADDDGVTVDVDGASRRFAYSVLGPGAVQVEFGQLPSELGATGDGH